MLVLNSPKFVQPYLVDPDEHRKTPEIIESRGYGVQRHEVLTKDSYILTMFRIVNKTDRSYRNYWSSTKVNKKLFHSKTITETDEREWIHLFLP